MAEPRSIDERVCTSSNWQPDGRGGFNCHTCGSFTADGSGIDDIERDCTKRYAPEARTSNPKADALRGLQSEYAADRAANYQEGLLQVPDECPAERIVREGADRIEQLTALLHECSEELIHAHLFIRTRERMHPDGVALYERLQVKIGEALQNG